MVRTIVAIGGGELRYKTTAAIDAYVAGLAKKRAGERRARALFIGTASHDSLPYFNTFRKTYTSDFDVKADVALLTKKDIPMEKIAEKIALADALYVGGGDTLYMLEVWERTGMIGLILDAYERGTVLAGLSAGAICWFKKMYTDSDVSAQSGYAVHDGIGLIDGIMTPHYGSRREFDDVAAGYALTAYAAEDDAAIVFKDGVLAGSLTSGGKAYRISSGVKEEIPPVTDAI